MSRQRLDFIDFTRGMAAVAVMVSHAGPRVGYLEDSGIGHDLLNLGQVGVIAFFLVSGFVIPLSLAHSRNLPSFAIRRAFRIYPLFLAMLGLSLTLQAVGVAYPSVPGPDRFATIAANLLFAAQYAHLPELVGGSWTLSIEVIWYAFFGLLFHLGVHRKPLALASVTSVAFVAIACACIATGLRLPLGRLGMVGVCLLGFCFHQAFDGRIGRREFGRCALMLVASIVFMLWTAFFHFRNPATTFRCVIVSWAAGMLLFCIPFVLRETAFFRWPAFMALGRYSYAIYLSHPPVIFLCMHVPAGPAIQSAAIAGTTLAVSIALFHLVEAPGIAAGKALDQALAARKASRYRQAAS